VTFEVSKVNRVAYRKYILTYEYYVCENDLSILYNSQQHVTLDLQLDISANGFEIRTVQSPKCIV
jgi:hypothetical protein